MALRPGKKRPSILALLGAALILVSLIGVYTGPDLLQYAFLPAEGTVSPAAQEPVSGDEDAEDSMSAEDGMDRSSRSTSDSQTAPVFSAARDAFSRYEKFASSSVWAGEDLQMTLQGQKSNITVSRKTGTSVSDVRLLLVGPRFFEVFPQEMTEGSALSAFEINNHQPSAILDSRLAFSLFGDVSPLGETVEFGGSEYTVVGVARHRRSLGAANELTIWAVLGADASLTPDLFTVSVRHARASDGFSTLWRTEAESAFGSGDFISLPQEKSRASLLPRLLLFALGVWAIKRWLRLLRGWGQRLIADARDRMARQYAISLTGYFLLRGLAAVLLAAVTLAALYGLAVFITQPLQVFPEWVPEKLVAMSSILARFWSLIGSNAAPLRLVTEQVAVLRFWHFLMRLGVFLFLLGLLKFRRKDPAAREA